MRLTIQQFRNYDHQVYETQDQGLVLVQGRSGAGKSTIFQAIYWLLYGSKRVRNIHPHGLKGKACVTLELGSMTIQRQANPSRLMFSDGGYLLEGDEASQAIINRFGPADFWLATSYIQQGCRCSLLSANPNERLDILNRLSFRDDDPDQIIDRISHKLTEVQTTYNHELQVYQQELDQIKDNPPFNHQATSQGLAQLKEEVDQLANRVDQLKEQHQQYLARLKIKVELEAKLANIEAELAKLPDIDPKLPDLVAQLEANHRQHLAYIRDQPQVVRIKSQLAELPPDQPIDDQTLDQLIAKGQLKVQHEAICKRWKIPYQPAAIEARLNRLRSRQVYRAYLQRVELSKELTKQLANLPDGTIDPEKLWALEQQHQTYQQNMKVCQRWNLAYDQSVISDRLTNLAKLIDQAKAAEALRAKAKQALALDQEISRLEAELSRLTLVDIPPDRSSELDAKIKHRDSLVQAQQVKPCPHCSRGIRIHNGELHPADYQPVNAKQLEQLTQEVNQLLQYMSSRNSLIMKRQQTETKRKPLETKLEQAKAVRDSLGKIEPVPDYPLDQLNQEYTDLTKLTYVPPIDIELARGQAKRYQIQAQLAQLDLTPVEPVDLTTADLEYQQLSQVVVIDVDDYQPIKTRRQLERQLSQLTQDDAEDDPRLDQLQTQLKAQQEAELKRAQLIPQQQTLIQSINSIDLVSVETDLQASQDRLTELRRQYEFDRYSVEMIDYQRYLTDKKEQLDEDQRSIAGLANLKLIAQKVEYELLDSIVTTINAKLEQILGSMFDDPITVNLSLYRQTKDRKVKPQVNLTINYKGGTYDNINQLSGGEGDRVSLALTIALSDLSGNPILLLDECLSSLDGTYREACTKTLRTIDHKLIMVISHEDVEGYYDAVINV